MSFLWRHSSEKILGNVDCMDVDRNNSSSLYTHRAWYNHFWHMTVLVIYIYAYIYVVTDDTYWKINKCDLSICIYHQYYTYNLRYRNQDNGHLSKEIWVVIFYQHFDLIYQNLLNLDQKWISVKHATDCKHYTVAKHQSRWPMADSITF